MNRRGWTVLVGVLVAAAIAAIVVTSSGGSNGVTDTSVTADADRGGPRYAANCAACHGPDMLGTDIGPPLLDPVYGPGHHADEAFQRAVAFGVTAHHWEFGSMPAIPGLSRNEVADIIAHIRRAQRAAGLASD